MNKLRDDITRIGGRALGIMEEYFDGKRDGTDKIKEASKMISAALKVEHMNQIALFSEKSLALRLIQHLPKDEQLRAKYIQITNPQLAGMKLLDRPKKVTAE